MEEPKEKQVGEENAEVFVFISILSCVLFYCVTTEPQKGSAKQIYSDCMETFQDSEKCEKLVLKQLLGSDKTETEKNQTPTLDPEIEKISDLDPKSKTVYRDKIEFL